MNLSTILNMYVVNMHLLMANFITLSTNP